eukprot:c24346_g1_i1 orf=401-1459(+)
MPVATGSGEGPLGWTVGCNLGTRGSHSHTEVFKCRRLTQQNSVIRVASAPSLVVHLNSDTSVVDITDTDVLSQGRQDSYQRFSTSSTSDGSPQTCCMTLADQLQLVSPPQHIYCERSCEKSSKEMLLSPPTNGFPTESGTLTTFHDIHNMLSIHHLPSLDVVSEESPSDSYAADRGFVESDAVSSCSSISEESPRISGNAFQGVSGDTEAQSSYKGPLYCMSSLEASLPVRNGLSRFYSGKSRSFTCLADVVSVKDLAKPENPYARKRKGVASLHSGLNRPNLYFHRSGTGITKKDLHNSKSSLALAVAMGMKEGIFDTDEQEFWAANSTTSRHSSLLGLQNDGYGFSPERP